MIDRRRTNSNSTDISQGVEGATSKSLMQGKCSPSQAASSSTSKIPHIKKLNPHGDTR